MNVLILNSAHEKYPRGSFPWVRATARAVQRCAGRDVRLVCSTEPSPWDIVTFLAGEHGIDQVHVVKAADGVEGARLYHRTCRGFGLDERKVSPVFLSRTDDRHPKAGWRLRDRIVLEHADLVLPVSIRPGGRLDSLLKEFSTRLDIRDTFRIPRETVSHPRPPDYSRLTPSRPPGGDWLVHWTRASAGPWPDETPRDFYHDLFARPDIYVRSAFETLLHILQVRRIAGSLWRLPADRRAVSFTALPMNEAFRLMRWRKRFVRFSFEPFGIAIRKQVLEEMGARPVEYVDGDSFSPDPERRMFQHAPGTRTDWRDEREWRLAGCLDISNIDSDDIVALVPGAGSRKLLLERLGHEVRTHVLFEKG